MRAASILSLVLGVLAVVIAVVDPGMDVAGIALGGLLAAVGSFGLLTE